MVFRETGRVDAPVYDLDALPQDHPVTGPAIIESHFTTIVVDPGAAPGARPASWSSNRSSAVTPSREADRHGRSHRSRSTGVSSRSCRTLRGRDPQDGQHAVAHGALRRDQHRARLLLRPRHRRLRAADRGRQLPDPRAARRRPDGPGDAAVPSRPQAAATPSCTTRPTTATRTPPTTPSWCRSSTTTACIASPSWPRPIRPIAATRCRRPTWARRATSIEEGALIFPAVQVQEDYRDNRDIIHMCMMRIRVPEPVVRRLSRHGGRGAHRRARDRPLGEELGWDAARRPCAALVRLQRAPHDRDDRRACRAGAPA